LRSGVEVSQKQEIPMHALLTTVVLWLSANFGLPANHDHPRLEFVPERKIVELRYKGLAAWQLQTGVVPAGLPGQRLTVSVYDDATKTIYLPEGWTGDTPADVSVLVHEMVHHLQNVGKLKFECPQEREQLAYKAQEKWLEMFGRDLLRDFEIDPFTLLISTKCMY
jgi:hypothetical protein